MFTKIRSTFQDRELMQQIVLLAWPTIMEQALQTVVQYADTAQVGAIGAQASAAVGLTGTMMWLINSPFFAMGMGVLSCISRSLGARDQGTAQRAAVVGRGGSYLGDKPLPARLAGRGRGNPPGCVHLFCHCVYAYGF